MTETKGTDRGKLLSLTEISRRTGISMPTLQKYKKRYADRIPSEGSGRRQRYPEEAVPVFEALRKESMGKRGRPRKAPAPKPRTRRRVAKTAKGGAGRRSSAEGLLTLAQVSRKTGISYPTLLRYVKMHLDRLPHSGTGRKRRFLPEAVPVFEKLRSEARGGRPPKGKTAAGKAGRRRGGATPAAPSAELAQLVEAVKRLEKRLSNLEKAIAKPLTVRISR